MNAGTNATTKLQCDMKDSCTSPITHIGEKGWIYCAEHAAARRECGYERCRKLRRWELKLLESGQPVPSYKPIRKPAPAPVAPGEYT